MTAAIYARKSTDQSSVSDEQRSVARQVEHARAYATRKGWIVADDHVYVDDGISGAEFANRPGYVALMSAVSHRAGSAPFQVVVMSDLDRLGREGIETGYALKQLVQAGVRVFSYLTDHEVELNDPTATLMMQVQAFAASMEREKASQRTHDTLLRKARAGHVTGGRVFGYDNIEITGPDGQRSHVERRINDGEAEVVHRIFELCAAGNGLTRITKTLNADGAVSPRAQRGRPHAWAASSVREVLHRHVYRGEIVWNQTRKCDSWGQHRSRPRPATDWLRVPAPELRIVSDHLWRTAHQKLAARREHSGCTLGVDRRGQHDRESRYLLTSFARCAQCGGSIVAHSRNHGGQRVYFYGCLTFWKKGASKCPNNLAGRMDAIDAEVLATLCDDVLRPSVVERAIALALEELTPASHDRTRDELEAEIRGLEGECRRLAEAIARGGRLDVLLRTLEDRQERLGTLQALRAAIGDVVPPAFDARADEGRLRDLVDDWRGLLVRDVASGREVLRTLLVGPLRFTPVVDERRRGYTFEGAIALDRLVSGIVDLPMPFLRTG